MKTKKRKRRKRLPPKLCPTHGTKLVYSPNKWGLHWHCPEPKCTVRCWGGQTSTPGDRETFKERKRAHEMFDTQWRNHLAFESRKSAYEWMRSVMELPASECHIGMFTAEQCRQLCFYIQELLAAGGRRE